MNIQLSTIEANNTLESFNCLLVGIVLWLLQWGSFLWFEFLTFLYILILVYLFFNTKTSVSAQTLLLVLWYSLVKSDLNGISWSCFNHPFTIKWVLVISWPTWWQDNTTRCCQMSTTWCWKKRKKSIFITYKLFQIYYIQGNCKKNPKLKCI